MENNTMMNTKKALTVDNARAAWDASEGLRSRVYEEALEFTAYYQADEILHYFRHYNAATGRDYSTLKDYEIDACRAWVKADTNNLITFFDDCIDVARALWVFTEDQKAKIYRVMDRIDTYEGALNGYYEMSDENFARLEKWIDDATDEACAVIAEACQECYTQFDDDGLLYDYFITFWLDGRDDLTFDGVNVYETITRKL